MIEHYACAAHRIACAVDTDIRSISVHVLGDRALPGGCRLTHRACLALDGDLDAPAGDVGPVHPETRQAVCRIVRRGTVDAPTWDRAIGG